MSSNLRALLEEQFEWPGPYTFKFVVHHERVAQVLALFPDGVPSTRPSKNGTYVGVTARLHMDSPDAVLAVYEEASRIDGIVSL